MALRSLGMARVLKDDKTGRLVVDKSTLRRKASFSGDEDVGDFEGRRRRRRRRRREEEDEDEAGDDEAGDDDLGDDEDTDEDAAGDDEAGDDDLGDDDLGDDEDVGEDDLGDDDVGDAEERRERRHKRRARRRSHRKERRDRRQGRHKVKWAKTALAGVSNTPDSVGDAITITIRPQHWFRAHDITFSGDLTAKIDTIFFGEKPVWNNSTGIPVTVFSSIGMLRGILNGQKIRPGLDIIIRGTAGTASSATTATLIGYKPMNQD